MTGIDPLLIVGFVALGCVVGFLAGLLGIGGGMTMVPILTIIFTRIAFPAAHVVHMAVATSTATIIFTAISSAREHHRHGAVLWPVVAGLAPGIIAGSLFGPQVVRGMSTSALALFFGVVVAFSATQMLLDKKPKPSRELPGKLGMFGVGGAIGLVSSMVGAGGGFMSVPFMAWCNVRIHNAVATSAALGLPIAIAGTVGFVIAGLGAQDMPRYSLGYIYLPALVSIVAASMLTAPIGARTAHRWPVKKLKRAFALLLYVLAAYMLWKAWASGGG
ncbi:MAG: sulfite exporter TauE/SafE family protein [Betaproteobacteria bacterium]|nr:sulfite exporter TauE/SafE family protein [Betaproteobacteria bacterium]